MESSNFNFTVKLTFFDEYYSEVNYRELVDEGFSELLTQCIDDILNDGLYQYISALGVTSISWNWSGESNFFIVYVKCNNGKQFDNIRKEINFFFNAPFTNIFDSTDENYFDMNCSVIDFDNECLKEPP